ncbi:cysteine proteinase, partial [Collybia nuda]
LLAFQAHLEKVDQQNAFSPSSSMADLHAREKTPLENRRHSISDNDDMAFLRRAFDRARATLNEPRPPQPFQPSLDQLRLSQRSKDEDIEQLLRPKRVPPTPLPPEADAQVNLLLNKRGIVSKFARESVNDQDLSRLKPGQWLNDEIVNFYGAMILGRSEECKENPGKWCESGDKALSVHYFSTFFWTKLKEGYEKSRLAKWTKKIDIFSKDVILIPINHNNAHWTGAAINFRQKRIESYDSMGMRRDVVFQLLRSYLDSEHRNKKKKPFDFTGWVDHSLEQEPLQENGYDCGVFTCQFLQGLSRGDEYVSCTQQDMPHLRRRMIWEICNATLRDDP